MIVSVFLERYTEIERENRILLEKMTHIMQTTTATSGLVPNPNGGNPVVAGNHNASVNRGNLFTPGGVNAMHQTSQMGANNNSIMLPMVNTGNGLTTAGSAKRSLNRDARKRELLKITMENQAILRRLQDQ